MTQERLKQIIFKKLYQDLSKAEIIPYEGNLWFIDRENKYWFLEYKKNGNLWWRYDFFEDFFFMFSLKREDYEVIICEWVEEVLNCKVITSTHVYPRHHRMVEEVLDYKVNALVGIIKGNDIRMEDMLNYKVTESHPHQPLSEERVRKVLSSVGPFL